MSTMPWDRYAAQAQAPTQGPAQMPWEKYPSGGSAAPQQDFSRLTANPKGEGTYQISTPDAQKLDVPYSNVDSLIGLHGFDFSSPGEQSRFAKDAGVDPNSVHSSAARKFLSGLIDPVGTGGADQGVVGGIRQVGGTAVNDLAQMPLHPLRAVGGGLKTAAYAGGTALGVPMPEAWNPVTPVVQGFLSDKSRGGLPLALENLAGHGLAAVEGGRATAGAAKLAPPLVDAVMPSSPLGDMLTKPRGTVPAEFASPQELKAYADKNDIPFNAAQATQHNLPLNLQSAGERATIGGTAVKQQIRAGQAAVMDHAQSLMDKLSPNTTDVGTAGAKLQTDIAAALDAQKGEVQQGYAAMDKAADGVSVDLKPLKAAASQTLKDSDFIRTNVPGLDPKRASSLLRAITGLPDSASFTDAGAVRSGLLDEARHPDNVLSEQAQGWIKNLTGVADSQMSQAAASSPDLTSLWRDTNAQWKGINEDFGSPRSPLYQALKETDPNKIPQKFTSQGQIGGSPYNAQLLDKYGIDKAPIKWALMGDMIKKDFGLYNGGKTLAGYSDPFLESMFTPAELDGVYKTGAIARSLKANTNYSGTAAVEGAMSDVQRPLRSMLPKAVAAKITNSQRLNNWLMNNPAPVSTPPASALTPIGIMGSLMGINQK